jgi:hypothetical protein
MFGLMSWQLRNTIAKPTILAWDGPIQAPALTDSLFATAAINAPPATMPD